jgi:hypothetical protein
MRNIFVPFLRRLLILSIIAIMGVLFISELSYRLLREDSSRAPKTINLVIPEGTAKKIAEGQSEPSIPEDIVFVVGDTLKVENQDVVDHQLGPLWIPAGKTASLPMGEVSNYAYSCSFRPSQYLGITIREPVTWASRLGAIALISNHHFLLVYNLVVRPLKPVESSIPLG